MLSAVVIVNSNIHVRVIMQNVITYLCVILLIIDPSVTDLNTRTFNCFDIRDSTCTGSIQNEEDFLDELNDCCLGAPLTYFTVGSDPQCISCKLLFAYVTYKH